jgi:hypothetical protein
MMNIINYIRLLSWRILINPSFSLVSKLNEFKKKGCYEKIENLERAIVVIVGVPESVIAMANNMANVNNLIRVILLLMSTILSLLVLTSNKFG